jgi:hypothetical protein
MSADKIKLYPFSGSAHEKVNASRSCCSFFAYAKHPETSKRLAKFNECNKYKNIILLRS